MRSAKIGKTGVELSVVGFGCWELNEDIERPSEGEDRAQAVLTAALDAGMDWIDTAEAYWNGDNETLIGKVLESIGPFKISSKVAPAPDGSGHGAATIRSACEASLQRLGVERLDVYLLHWPDESGVPLEESWEAMASLAHDGLVRAIGLSNFSQDQVAQCDAIRHVDLVQEGLSPVHHLENRELLAWCGDHAITGVTYEPLAGGELTGAATDERTVAVVDGIRSIAERLGTSLPQVAIAWNLRQPGVSMTLAGSRNPAHTTDNAAGGSLDLDDATLAELDTLIPLGPAFSG